MKTVDLSLSKQKQLESIIGVTVLGNQVSVGSNLPYPLECVHYEFYRKHIELHVEGSVSKNFCNFLKKNLPNNDLAIHVDRNFCKYAYMLKRNVEGWNNIQDLGTAILELRNIVEPILCIYSEQIANDFELARILGDYYEEQELSLPFHINVIDELHANENAHTRILTQLLKYKEDGKNLILSSFLEQLPEFNIDDFNIDNSAIYFNRDYIDCLIEKKQEFAVIIENKIHWAIDQKKQIENYVLIELKRGIPKDRIWVVYLTRDGSKKVEDYSLTEKTKELLKNHFVEMNYRHDILPWLKDIILPNCKLREEWLISALKQYVDHLEGLFDIRESQKDFLKKIEDRIKNSIDCRKEMQKSEVYLKLNSFKNKLNNLQNIVDFSIDNIVKPIINNLQNTTTEIFKELYPNEDITFNNQVNKGYFQIYFNKWHKRWGNFVHLEWIPLETEHLFSGSMYTLALHVERDDIIKQFKNAIDVHTPKILTINSKDNGLFYQKNITARVPISDMKYEELICFLRNIYCDVNQIYDFIEQHV